MSRLNNGRILEFRPTRRSWALQIWSKNWPRLFGRTEDAEVSAVDDGLSDFTLSIPVHLDE